jgi:hypothetical protein
MSSTTRFDFWSRWLQTSLWSYALTGVLLVVFDHRAVPFLAGSVNERFFGQPDMPAAIEPYHRFVYGLVGAFLMGWAIGLAMVVRHGFKARLPWAWTTVAVSIGVWFAVDTGASVWHGAWVNAALNCVGAFFLGLPLVMTARAFRSGDLGQAG